MKWLEKIRVTLRTGPDRESGPALIGERYRVQRVLGRNERSCVLLCLDERLLARPVAVKVFIPGTRKGDDGEIAWARSHFEDECRLLASLSHPNVVSILDRGSTPDGQPYLVTEFVDGATLRSLLPPAGMDLERAAAILRQIGDALTHIHARGVVHRDLKPENVLVRPAADGRDHATIVDFGLASTVKRSPDATGVVKTRVAGTIPYMAPEQFEGSASAASDVFALGVMAYEMLTGRRPFNPSNPFQMPTLQRRGVGTPPRALRPDLPTGAETAVLRALAFDPEKRPFPAREFTDAVHGAVVGEAVLLVEPELPGDAAPGGPFPAGGAMPLDSPYYVVRDADREIMQACWRGDAVVLVKGARQVGKTSLLARALHECARQGARTACIDLQRVGGSDLKSVDAFYRASAELISDQMDLPFLPDAQWQPSRSANRNFERFVRSTVLGSGRDRIVLAFDEADRLFPFEYGNEVFGLFRTWHNARGLEPAGPWKRLTLAIAYATEAHLFISDPNQSPFNVGTRIDLADFTPADVADLDSRYGAALGSADRLERFTGLLGGHPFLVQRGFEFLTLQGRSLEDLETVACAGDGPFGVHLRRLRSMIERNPSLEAAIGGVLRGSGCAGSDEFYRLKCGGVLAGDAPKDARFRTGLYKEFFRMWYGR